MTSYGASLRLPIIFAVALAVELSTGETSHAATFTVTKTIERILLTAHATPIAHCERL